MRAVLVREFGPPEQLAVEAVADPVPAAGEVVVRIGATAVNFVDSLVVTGTYQFLPPRPFVPGKLPAGTICAVGAGVDGLKVGDRVLTLAEQGGYAQMAAVKAADCFLLPQGLSFVDAAAMALAYDTAWFALFERARAKAGDSVLVLGASGGVGLAAVQLAKAYGLKVLAGISSPAKADAVRAAGAEGIVDLSTPDLRESLRAQVYAQTAGQGVDIILDPLGDAVFDAALRALAWRGRLVVIGFAAGRIPSLKVNYLLVKNIEVSGLQVSDYRKRTPDLMAACLADIFRLYAEGRLKPAPTVTFGLEEAGRALAMVRDRAVPGRAVLTPQSSLGEE